MNKIIINFTPNGMVPKKSDNRYVPITAEEIVKDVIRVASLGISMVHLHARDDQSGEPVADPEIFRRIICEIREQVPDLIICVTTSGRNVMEFEKRSAVLELDGDAKPDMASLTLSSLNFPQAASVNSPDMIVQLAKKMQECGIKPELEVFDSGMINYMKYLAKKRVIESPFYINLLLGSIASAQANLLHAGIMLNDLPAESYWSFAGIGDSQLKMNLLGVALGGGIRVGLEDNIWLSSARDIPASNFELVERVHNLLKILDKESMQPSELRDRLGLNPGYGKYGLA